MILLPLIPALFVVLGCLVAAQFNTHLRALAFGAVGGFGVTLLPYLILRFTGVFYPYYSQGDYTIEVQSENAVVGFFWWATYAYTLTDAFLCARFLSVPDGG